MDRIAPGHHLHAGPDGNRRHSRPDGRFTRIRGPQELLTATPRLAYGVGGGPIDEDAVRAADAVICCAGWLPDAHRRRVDAWCALHSTAWHRCHAEGLRFVLGPMSVPGRTVSHGAPGVVCSSLPTCPRNWPRIGAWRS